MRFACQWGHLKVNENQCTRCKVCVKCEPRILRDKCALCEKCEELMFTACDHCKPDGCWSRPHCGHSEHRTLCDYCVERDGGLGFAMMGQ